MVRSSIRRRCACLMDRGSSKCGRNGDQVQINIGWEVRLPADVVRKVHSQKCIERFGQHLLHCRHCKSLVPSESFCSPAKTAANQLFAVYDNFHSTKSSGMRSCNVNHCYLRYTPNTPPCFVTCMHASLRTPREPSSLLRATAEAVDKRNPGPFSTCHW